MDRRPLQSPQTTAEPPPLSSLRNQPQPELETRHSYALLLLLGLIQLERTLGFM